MAEQVIIEICPPELWLPIKGYESFYQISNLGRVKALAKTVDVGLGRLQHYEERIMSSSIASNGYLMIGFQVNNIHKSLTVHRLVALHFVPNPNNYRVVNHIDGNKLNPVATNLEWGTHSYNNKHAYATGLKTGAWVGKTGKLHPNSKPLIQYNKDREIIKEWECSALAAKELGINPNNIRAVCGHDYKTYKGSRWAFKS